MSVLKSRKPSLEPAPKTHKNRTGIGNSPTTKADLKMLTVGACEPQQQGWARDNLLASSQHQVDNAKKCKSFCDKQKNGETCV